jgi:dTDP-4-amino-4,6-dideoxygalactose transaminase
MTTLGEGGAITTNDLSLDQQIRDIRQYGRETAWGSNYKMTSVQAAVGLVQLKRLDSMINMRIRLANKRTEILSEIELLTLPYELNGFKHVFYVYGILLPPEWAGEKRDKIISMLAEKYNIVCSITSPPQYNRWEYIRKKCGSPSLPISEMICDRLICLPLHPLMTDEQNEFCCSVLIDAINRIK